MGRIWKSTNCGDDVLRRLCSATIARRREKNSTIVQAGMKRYKSPEGKGLSTFMLPFKSPSLAYLVGSIHRTDGAVSSLHLHANTLFRDDFHLSQPLCEGFKLWRYTEETSVNFALENIAVHVDHITAYDLSDVDRLVYGLDDVCWRVIFHKLITLPMGMRQTTTELKIKDPRGELVIIRKAQCAPHITVNLAPHLATMMRDMNMLWRRKTDQSLSVLERIQVEIDLEFQENGQMYQVIRFITQFPDQDMSCGVDIDSKAIFGSRIHLH